MLFHKSTYLTGFDIGSNFIKLVQLRKTKKKYLLNKYGITKIAQGSFAQGNIIDVKYLANKVTTLFKKQKISKKDISIAIGSNSIMIKIINILITPKIKSKSASKKDLHDLIVREAALFIPYDMNEINFDYQIIGKDSQNDINVLIVAVKKNIIAQYTDLIIRSGLKLKVIDVDVFALQNAYESFFKEKFFNDSSTTLLVDAGASKISFSMFYNNMPVIIKDLNFGTNQIMDTISTEFNLTKSKAEQAIREKEKPLYNKIQKTIRVFIESWCKEIYAIINNIPKIYNSQKEFSPKIMLCGGGALITEFKDQLQNSLSFLKIDTKISIMDNLQFLDLHKNTISPNIFKQTIPLYPIALGVALRS